jgi:hypothetical protein
MQSWRHANWEGLGGLTHSLGGLTMQSWEGCSRVGTGKTQSWEG